MECYGEPEGRFERREARCSQPLHLPRVAHQPGFAAISAPVKARHIAGEENQRRIVRRNLRREHGSAATEPEWKRVVHGASSGSDLWTRRIGRTAIALPMVS